MRVEHAQRNEGRAEHSKVLSRSTNLLTTFTYAGTETVLKSEGHVIVAGHPDDAERFAASD